MNTIRIEGFAEISENGFAFNSGLPVEEPVLEEALKMRGTLKVSKNACVEFQDNKRVYLPPENNKVSSGENYNIRRTSRHYIIQLKLPIVEKRAVSEQTLTDIIPVVMGEITLDRIETLSPALNGLFTPFGSPVSRGTETR